VNSKNNRLVKQPQGKDKDMRATAYTKKRQLRSATYFRSCKKWCLIWFGALVLVTSETAIATTFYVDVGGEAPVFDPDYVTIQAGDTVEWTWRSIGHSHSVTSGTGGVADGVFNSGTHGDPYTFSFTFPEPGTFDYFCMPHYGIGMLGIVEVVAPTTTATFGNISTRLRVDSGDNVLIGGFIITGTQPKQVIVRAIGPSLASFFPGVLSDPTLELRDSSGNLISSNDNWRSDQEAAIIATGIPPSHDLESAIVATLPANTSAYTAIVRGANSATGIGVVEAYDLNQTVDSKLANISTRGLVQTGDDVLIGGLIVLGQNSLRVIVRAIGPSLPVPGPLANPTLELRDGNGSLTASNDDWRSDQETEIIATGVAPTNDLESAIVRTLAAGNYTAIVRGVGGTGVGLVDAYGLN
jgi:plastocyanin